MCCLPFPSCLCQFVFVPQCTSVPAIYFLVRVFSMYDLPVWTFASWPTHCTSLLNKLSLDVYLYVYVSAFWDPVLSQTLTDMFCSFMWTGLKNKIKYNSHVLVDKAVLWVVPYQPIQKQCWAGRLIRHMITLTLQFIELYLQNILGFIYRLNGKGDKGEGPKHSNDTKP